MQAVDTTGAGDTVVGALAAALAAGRLPREALTRAQAAAALAVTGSAPSRRCRRPPRSTRSSPTCTFRETPVNAHPVIFDTDPGIDDAMALAMLALDPRAELVGITTVFGNVPIRLTTRNALALRERFGIDHVPVARGARPLVKPAGDFADFVHGANGLGNVGLPSRWRARSAPGRAVHRRDGAPAFGRAGAGAGRAADQPGAGAAARPELPRHVREVVLMGGAFGTHGHGGNMSPVAEANIFNDPHAADLVATAPWPVTFVGLDVTHEVVMTTGYLDELGARGGPHGAFLRDITRFYEAFYEFRTGGGICCHDATAVACALDASAFTRRPGAVRVVTEGLAAGQTIQSVRGSRFPPPTGTGDLSSRSAPASTSRGCWPTSAGSFRLKHEKSPARAGFVRPKPGSGQTAITALAGPGRARRPSGFSVVLAVVDSAAAVALFFAAFFTGSAFFSAGFGAAAFFGAGFWQLGLLDDRAGPGASSAATAGAAAFFSAAFFAAAPAASLASWRRAGAEPVGSAATARAGFGVAFLVLLGSQFGLPRPRGRRRRQGLPRLRLELPSSAPAFFGSSLLGSRFGLLDHWAGAGAGAGSATAWERLPSSAPASAWPSLAAAFFGGRFGLLDHRSRCRRRGQVLRRPSDDGRGRRLRGLAGWLLGRSGGRVAATASGAAAVFVAITVLQMRLTLRTRPVAGRGAGVILGPRSCSAQAPGAVNGKVSRRRRRTAAARQAQSQDRAPPD